jgi:hypothetical protein
MCPVVGLTFLVVDIPSPDPYLPLVTHSHNVARELCLLHRPKVGTCKLLGHSSVKSLMIRSDQIRSDQITATKQTV